MKTTPEQQIKLKKIAKVLWIFVGIIFSILAITYLSVETTQEPTKQETAIPKLSQFKQDSIKHINHILSQFDKYTGEHYNSVEAIKGTMNNPASFELVETRYLDFANDGIRVIIKFRGTNIYGGVVTQKCVVLVDTAGNVTDIKQLDL